MQTWRRKSAGWSMQCELSERGSATPRLKTADAATRKPLFQDFSSTHAYDGHAGHEQDEARPAQEAVERAHIVVRKSVGSRRQLALSGQ
jgi:hypothetical protein